MMKLLRKHRDWLMIVIAILAIPFIFYSVQRPDYGAMRSDKFARMYDRNVSMLEAQQTVRLLTLAQELGMSEFVETLTAGAGRTPQRGVPTGESDLDALNSEIVGRINASGRAYLTQTKLRDRTVMRIGLGNVLTTEEHLRAAWEMIQETASEL